MQTSRSQKDKILFFFGRTGANWFSSMDNVSFWWTRSLTCCPILSLITRIRLLFPGVRFVRQESLNFYHTEVMGKHIVGTQILRKLLKKWLLLDMASNFLQIVLYFFVLFQIFRICSQSFVYVSCFTCSSNLVQGSIRTSSKEWIQT